MRDGTKWPKKRVAEGVFAGLLKGVNAMEDRLKGKNKKPKFKQTVCINI